MSDMRSNLWRASSVESFEGAGAGASTLDVDLLIVGGGFTGCSAALEAARRGASVCLLEAETIGHGGSGRNVGLANAGLWLKPDQIVARMGKAAGERLIAILAEAPARVFGLIEREGIDCEATRNGTLHCAHAESGLADLEDRLRQGQSYGAPLRLLDAETTARRTGTNAYRGALWDPRAGVVQPLAYCRGLARAAQGAGARICERAPVSALRHENGAWRAVGAGFEVRARNVLLATNAYHLGVADPFAPAYTPVHYCQFATAPIPERERERILPQGEGCWDTAMVMSSFRMDRAGRMIVGGLGDLESFGASTHTAWARRKLRALFPSLADLPFEHAWSGRIAMTDDHIPKVVAFGPHAYACFGYSGRGIGPGTVFGAQAAIALLERDEDALPVAPISAYAERFSAAKALYYETGATLAHLAAAR